MNRSHADAKLHGKISKGIKTPPANCCINCSPSLCGIQSWAHPSVRGRTSITKNHDSFCRDLEYSKTFVQICIVVSVRSTADKKRKIAKRGVHYAPRHKLSKKSPCSDAIWVKIK